MRISGRFGWFVLGGVAAVPLLSGLFLALDKLVGARRPEGAPPGVEVSEPWGAVDLDHLQIDPNEGMDKAIVRSFGSEVPGAFDPDKDKVREYDILALSGGGSNGAFGAGLLVGWTASGKRPKFKIVTGVSTGALQATPAFLGPDYDYILREVYTQYDTEDIYRRRSLLLVLHKDAANSTKPLMKIITEYVTPEILAAVAREHKAGRRLFLGTTNVDTREFVIWNMGAIAASGREGALDLYRKVMLASCSIPIVFPPVYFAVEAEGREYHEMHCDGGAYSQAFFRGFLLDFEDAMEDVRLAAKDVEIRLFIINNGKSLIPKERRNVAPRATSIAVVSLNNLFKITMMASLYRMFVLAKSTDIDFNLASIPSDSDLVLPPLVFDRERMKGLYDLGYEMAKDGYKWSKVPPALDRDEVEAAESGAEEEPEAQQQNTK